MKDIRELLSEALLHAGATHTFGDVARAVRDGQAQAWGDDRAAIVSELVTYPQRKSLRLWLVAGEMDPVLDLWEGPVQHFARAEGCDMVEAAGRPGWERVMAPRGWRKVGIMLRKDLQA